MEFTLRETPSSQAPDREGPQLTGGQVTEVEAQQKTSSDQEGSSVIAGFLPTKLTMPPSPPGLVPRERLFDALDAAVRGPLTLVAGSAGIGKSALVGSWINSGRAPGPVAWLSLDASDDSRPRFWRLVLAALTSAGVGAGEDGAQLAISSDQTVDTVLPVLVGMLSDLDHPVVVVLDDFDEITDPTIMADIELLLRTPPPALRLIATARRTPSLRVQRLRLSGAVTEIDARELVFTDDEARLLLEGAGVDLSDADLRLLWERTEGWAAGLRLTAMALRNRRDAGGFVQQFAGDEAPVADYLFEEILSAQPPHIREFLLRTSITDTICGGLADALTGQAGGGATLAELQQDGVMATALDDHREWFRYHGLFAGLLRSVLRREDPALVPELHRRAARWLAERGRGVEAASHAATAQDWDLLGDIVATQSFSLLVRGELSELAQVLQQVPSPRIQSNPGFPLAIAGAALEVGDYREAEGWLALADANVALIREQDRDTFHIGRAIIGLYYCRLTGDVTAALDDARVLMGSSSDSALTEVSFATDLRALALINLGALELWTGHLGDALRDLNAGIEAAQARSLEYLELYGRAHRAVYHLWAGDPRAAQIESEAALELADRRGWRGTPRASVALAVQGILQLIHGEIDRAETTLVAATRAIARSVERPLRAHVAANSARAMRANGRPADGLKCIAEVRVDVEDSPFWAPIRIPALSIEAMLLSDLGRTDEAAALIEPETAGDNPDACLSLADIRLVQNRPEDALALVDRGLARPSMVTTEVRGGLARALAYRQLGDEAASFEALERALDAAAPHDCRLPFLLAGAAGGALLEHHLRAGTAHRSLVSELLQQLTRSENRSALADRPAAPAAATLAEPLSDRELAVLRYLPTVMSNREIADELFVSVNTVKTHVKQIYRKLGAHDRRDAVTRARRLGLLAPPSSLS